MSEDKDNMLSVCLCIIAALSGSAVSDIRSDFQKLYAKRTQILRSGSVEKYSKTIVDDYIWITNRGRVKRGKSAFLGFVRLQMDAISSAKSVSYRILSIDKGDTEVAVKMLQTVTLEKRAGNERQRKVTLKAFSYETWVRYGSTWKSAKYTELNTELR